jgi:hypothetical protein
MTAGFHAAMRGSVNDVRVCNDKGIRDGGDLERERERVK